MSRLMRTFGPVAVVVSLAAATIAQSPSFAGNWKLNLAKSQLGGVVYSFDKMPSGTIRYSGGGFEAEFDLAGKEYVTPGGLVSIGKELSPTSWEFAFRMNGKIVQTTHLTLNGNSINSVSDVIGADGKVTEAKTTYTRVSGGPGFMGKWKGGKVAGAATTLMIALDGANGITMTLPEAQTTVTGTFDGKDYPLMQAGQALEFTNAFAKAGNTIKVTGKIDGKAFTEEVYALSVDGKTLTDESTAVATGEKTTAVFERQ